METDIVHAQPWTSLRRTSLRLLLASLLLAGPALAAPPLAAGGQGAGWSAAAPLQQDPAIGGGGLPSSDAAAPLPPEQLDPWQPFNRRMYGFNRGLDRAILLPVARGYVRVVPQVMRRGVSNFFGNLYQPITVANDLLQARPGPAASATGRFLMNLTLGVGGLFDPATEAGFDFHENDWGRTLAGWGWKRSRYLVLPLFGPATVRDTIGKGINTRVSPVRYVADEWGPGVSLLYGIDARSRGLAAETFLADAEDEYLLVRDAYLQRRRCQIVDCSDELPEYLLPDYDIELPDFDWRSD